MAYVNFEVHKLMRAPKGGAEVDRLREELAEKKLEVTELAHPAYAQVWLDAWKSVKEEVNKSKKDIERVKGGLLEARK